MDLTPNYSLKKPEYSNAINVNDLNDNADTVDTQLKANADAISSHKSETASTSVKGHVQLYNGTDSTSTALAATANSVKLAMDQANSAFQSANDGKAGIANAVTAKGVSASSSDTFATLATKIGQIITDPSVGTTDAVAADLLSGKKAVSQGSLMTGTMPNNGSQTATLQITGAGQPTKTIPAGYTSGGTITANLAAGLAQYILNTAMIGGVQGTAIGLKSATGTFDFDAETQQDYTVSGLAFTPKMVGAFTGQTIDNMLNEKEAFWLHPGRSTGGLMTGDGSGVSSKMSVTSIITNGFTVYIGRDVWSSNQHCYWYALG